MRADRALCETNRRRSPPCQGRRERLCGPCSRSPRRAEEAAIEVIDALEAPAARFFRGGHLPEKAAEEVVALAGPGHAIGEALGDDLVFQKAEVLGDDGDEKLEDEALGAGAVFAARDHVAEDAGEGVGGLAGDFDAVVAEDGRLRAREEEAEGGGAGGEVAEIDALDGIKELLVEIVDPEFVEVAEDGVGGFVRDDVAPVVEELVVVALEFFAARFHLEKHALGPEEVGEFLAALGPRALALDEFELCGAGLFRDAKLEGRAGFGHALVAERAEEAFEESLGLALLVTADRGVDEGDEFFEGGAQFGGGHGCGEWGEAGAEGQCAANCLP